MRTENRALDDYGYSYLYELCASLDPAMADQNKQFDSQAFQTLLLQRLNDKLTEAIKDKPNLTSVPEVTKVFGGLNLASMASI